jgi:hypothetical protein
MLARRPDLARPWAERGQRPREPPPCRLPRAGSGHHGDAARRRRAHLAVDARAGEGAHRGTAHRLTPPVSLARDEEDGGAGRGNELGLPRAVAAGGFCSAETHARPSIFAQRLRSTRALSGFLRPRRDEELAAQAQVASRAAVSARAGKKVGP